MITLSIILVLVQLGGGDESSRPAVGSVIGGPDLAAGDCIDIAGGSAERFILADCAVAHDGEVVQRLIHPAAGTDYPGPVALTAWLGNQCSEQAADYLGAPLLQTTLEARSNVPTIDEWVAGDGGITCYVASADRAPLTASVAGRAEAVARGSQIPVSRLIVGDCFAPPPGVAAYELNSNSAVVLIPGCEGAYNGVFFGRDELPGELGTPFAGDENVGSETSARCAALFTETFTTDAAGFNYRYWRPNEASWNTGDRQILCAILDDDPLLEPFDPDAFAPFHTVAVGTCFTLGPEETDQTLRLDDQVRLVDCASPHVGQMIASGDLQLPDTAAYPGDETLRTEASAECAALFEDFVGISPADSAYGRLPFWYPNQPGWESGDRRFACAVLEAESRTGSLEDSGR
jgi:hypothetical protein